MIKNKIVLIAFLTILSVHINCFSKISPAEDLEFLQFMQTLFSDSDEFSDDPEAMSFLESLAGEDWESIAGEDVWQEEDTAEETKKKSSIKEDDLDSQAAFLKTEDDALSHLSQQAFNEYVTIFIEQLERLMLHVQSWKLRLDLSQIGEHQRAISTIIPTLKIIQDLEGTEEKGVLVHPYLQVFFSSEYQKLRTNILEAIEVLQELNTLVADMDSEEESYAEYDPNKGIFLGAELDKEAFENSLTNLYRGILTNISQDLQKLLSSEKVKTNLKSLEKKRQEQVKALIRSHYNDNSEQFFATVLQIATHEARQGHSELAHEIRDRN